MDLFDALTSAILTSLLHSVIIYLLVTLWATIFSGALSTIKYQVYFFSIMLIGLDFIYGIVSFHNQSFDLVSPLGNHFGTIWKENQFQTANYLDVFTGRYKLIIPIIYFGGMFVKVLQYALGIINLNALKKQKCGSLEQKIEDLFKSLNERLQINKSVTLVLTNAFIIPCTIGFIKPVIFLPIALANRLTIAETEFILMHELLHIKRSDYLHNMAQEMIKVLLFFNPIVWLLDNKIKDERENCCDDLVINHGKDKLEYAKSLVLIEELRHAAATFSLNYLGNGEKQFFKRIKRICNMKTKNVTGTNRTYSIFIGFVLTLMMSSWISKNNHNAPPSNEKVVKTAVKRLRPQTDTQIIDRDSSIKIYASHRITYTNHKGPIPNAPETVLKKRSEEVSELKKAEEKRNHQKDSKIQSEISDKKSTVSLGNKYNVSFLENDKMPPVIQENAEKNEAPAQKKTKIVHGLSIETKTL